MHRDTEPTLETVTGAEQNLVMEDASNHYMQSTITKKDNLEADILLQHQLLYGHKDTDTKV